MASQAAMFRTELSTLALAQEIVTQFFAKILKVRTDDLAASRETSCLQTNRVTTGSMQRMQAGQPHTGSPVLTPADSRPR
ncbi:MAG: hypothetical protein ACKPHU_12645, partial [Planctomycetaceae bacterium]